MKKAMLILLFVGGLGSFANAQLLSPGLELGYGGFTPPVLSGDAKTRQAFFSDGIQGSQTVTSTGAFHVALTAKVWRVTLGVEGSYEAVMVRNDFGVPGGLPGEVKASSRYWTVMPRVQWNYATLAAGRLKLYGGLAAGVYGVTSVLKQNNSNSNPDHSESGSGFAYQVTGVGASLGGKVTFFLEGGYGYLGIVNGGVRFKLK